MSEKAFCKMCVTICGIFCPDEGAVVGYGNCIQVKYPAKWGVQIAGMIFQTRSSPAERKDKNLRSAGLLYIRISIVSGLIREIP